MHSLKSQLLYWIPTSLIALNWTFGGVSAVLKTASSIEVFSRLGYPAYFGVMLGAAQLLGVVAILAPVPRALREWAYAGLTFDVTAGIVSLLAIGTPAWQVSIPVVALVLVLTSTRRGGGGEHMADIERISVEEAREEANANQVLLVCADDDEAKCRTPLMSVTMARRIPAARWVRHHRG